ncbi:MAG: DUF91 domain-containing protein [Deltaproteobacteria bacterium]|nr:MAG: DUF91 domain-containing protein [Deltaproteobacteria bacterium]
MTANAEDRPYVWQMIRRAVDELGPSTTNVAVRNWILERWPDTNRNTISCQIIVCTVNHASRVHYPENKKPRKANLQYDFLFRPTRGELELFDSAKHGDWEIVEQEDGRNLVRRIDAPEPVPSESGIFAAEAHLRDYLADHLELIEPGLSLYADEDGNAGVEYTTPVGRIDILAQDANEGLVVIELKVSKGPDAVVGQVLRYKGWVVHHLAVGKPVRGVIVAGHITDRIRYAVSQVADVMLLEYELAVTLKAVSAMS